MKYLRYMGATVRCVIVMCCSIHQALPQVNPVPGDPLTGNGDVPRSVLTYTGLFSHHFGSSPIDDMSGFAVPANAARPTQSFEGTLTLSGFSNDSFTEISDVDHLLPPGSEESAWKQLAPFSFQFVQNGSYIIPARQGLIYTRNPDWNYIIGPGRVWRENSDHGYMRAAMPFALVERNQNCVHNGELTFLFDKNVSPRVSNVYYQITKETCYTMKFNEWGMLAATYMPGPVASDTAIENAQAEEIEARMPTKPFGALATDYPNAGLTLGNFAKKYTCTGGDPTCVTTYGAVVNGINYSSGTNCATRSGNYAFCSYMMLPSYSTAKTVFAEAALARLGEMYGAGIYNRLIRQFISPNAGRWSRTTLTDALDMATGNYDYSGYEADENSPTMSAFLDAEPYSSKINDAFAFHRHHAPPDTLWVYHSSDIFLATSAMNLYLQRRKGASADVFKEILSDVYIPLNVSQGFRSMLRTDDSPTGHPTGYYGLFYTQDDIAKIANWLNNGKGVIDGAQVLEPRRLRESLFRDPGVAGLGVPVPGDTGFFYKDGTWGKTMTPAQFPQYSCTFRIAFMSGFGGITVLLLPDGVTYYIFTDDDQFHWYDAVREINKIAPFCPQG